MQDVRPGEYVQMMMIANFLSNNYPKYFELTSYEHPVLGARDSLVINKYGVTVDVKLLNSLNIDFVLNKITLISDLGVYTFNNILTDKTVI